MRRGSNRSHQRVHDCLASKITGDTSDTRMGMCRFEGEGERAVWRTIERHAQCYQIPHPRRAFLSNQAGNDRVDQSSPGRDGVGGMLFGTVFRVERCGKATLRPGG